ncbi:MAG: DUF192 domain-containing protein [Candidatus Cloacimonadales bacterium]|jgi:hypothetical protein|nr:DUF192 domain-containing protein [Candidatus Cloacimonadota bacterium]MDY0380580.1 DUF192 domain-containing protein [Candidatus Cloacimonadaceae bacterium]HCM15389.1 hypothetical protein [Candidatus Cloacimonas sp.]MCB5256094.1 DUF192 domain-containing protein [Candidatus Cloacimonadota bacterium]MCB5263318.1 DUF192 domain-containing protein [Candidatus Cloacimonadota bacterium]
MNRILVSFGLLISILFACGCPKAPMEEKDNSGYSFRKDGTLQIHSATGILKAEFDIEIVESQSELAQGLKYRESMAETQGMLFIFEQIDYHSFWMQDTYLSLDMIFIDHYNKIINIAKNTTPFSEDPIFPEKPNQYVLELLAGTTDKLNITDTDEVTWQRN